MNKMELLEVRGKCGNPVPILIPIEVIKGLDYLSNEAVRKELSIKKKFLFASRGKNYVYNIQY